MKVHLYTMPRCSGCASWRVFLQHEGIDYQEHPLSEVPAHRCSRLLQEAARGDMQDPPEHGPLAPVVTVEHDDGHHALIAHGTLPFFALPGSVQARRAEG